MGKIWSKPNKGEIETEEKHAGNATGMTFIAIAIAAKVATTC